MTKTISTRMPEEMVRELERIAEEEHLDRAALIRKMLLADIEEYRIRRAAEAYRRGEKSVEAAARDAGVATWTMIDHLIKENIQPPPQPREELEEEFEAAIDEPDA